MVSRRLLGLGIAGLRFASYLLQSYNSILLRQSQTPPCSCTIRIKTWYTFFMLKTVLMAFPQHLLHVSGALRQEFSLKDLDMLHHLVCMSSTLALVFLSHQ